MTTLSTGTRMIKETTQMNVKLDTFKTILFTVACAVLWAARRSVAINVWLCTISVQFSSSLQHHQVTQWSIQGQQFKIRYQQYAHHSSTLRNPPNVYTVDQSFPKSRSHTSMCIERFISDSTWHNTSLIIFHITKCPLLKTRGNTATYLHRKYL